jgi:hypothetical protein
VLHLAALLAAMKYTSIYKRPKSPYWYISYWSAKYAKRVHESTKFRLDDPTGRRKALSYAQERSTEAQAYRPLVDGEIWSAWALDYIRIRYRRSPLSLKRGENAWAALSEFMDWAAIKMPRTFEYRHIEMYLSWREQQKRHCGKPIARNTAITELKFLGVLMREAQRRGYCEQNPCMRMGLKRDPVKEKPEMTDAEIAHIRLKLAELIEKDPTREWMCICFEIAIHQGCRLSETSLPLHWVDLARRTISFRIKGGKIFTTALHSELVPLVLKLRAENKTITCALPRMVSKEWHFFFKDIGLPHLCFHCTRVTVVTRLARAGVSQSQAMRFVGHASETVHRIYQRLSAADLQACLDAIPA